MSLRPAIFIDKDGTLVEDLPLNADPARIRLMPQAGEALAQLRSMGFALFLASNQAGIAQGRLSESQLWQGFVHIQRLLQACGVHIDDFYYCPHWPDGTLPRYAIHCHCRKPLPGLLLRAAREHGLRLGDSWMIGDILDDIEAGRRAGCRSLLLDQGGETEWRTGPWRMPDAIAEDWQQAAQLIAASTSAA